MKKIRNKVTRGVKGIVFLLILAAVVMCLDRSLKLIQEDNLCPRYYEYADDTFDVAFLGSSLVMYGIYPMELYDEYGIASYNLSTGNQSLEASFLLAGEVIEKDHPSLIVLDCSRAWLDEETMEPQYVHYITDTMPYLNRNRIDMIRELSTDDADLKPLLFPLIAYHSRWQELTYEDALPQAKKDVYGAKVTGRVEVSAPFDEAMITPNTMTDTSRQYIEKTIDLCRENDTEILLLTMPILGQNKFFDQHGFNIRASAAQDVTALAGEKGVLHVDYLAQTYELGLDLQKDAYDGEHLNRWGAAKFTKILGQMITDNFEIPDRRGESGTYAELSRDLISYPLNRMKDSLNRSLFLRDYAATLRSDAHEEPVEDAIVLVALNGKVDGNILTEEDAALIQGFGIKQDLHSWEGHGWIAVIDGGELIYETTKEKLAENKMNADVAESSGVSGEKAADKSTQDGGSTEAAEEKDAETGEEEVPGTSEDTEQEESASDSGEFPDYPDSYSGTAGKINYEISSGRISEETGEVRSDASIVVNGLEYTSGDRGLQFAVFNKSTGELMDACWLNIYSLALSCTHDNH